MVCWACIEGDNRYEHTCTQEKVDKEMDNLKPSDWCEKMFERTGDTNYLSMYNTWKERNQ